MDSCLYGYELIHHRVTQSFTEFYSFDFKLIGMVPKEKEE